MLYLVAQEERYFLKCVKEYGQIDLSEIIFCYGQNTKNIRVQILVESVYSL
jgi:hypothetical protein